MEMINLSLPVANRFVTDYLQQNEDVSSFFHYSYQKEASYDERLKELASRSFMRDEVANHIETYMKKFPCSEKVTESIEKLRKKDSVVVIGGQQAGVLTGPLYSIHKVISILMLAKEREEKLGIPVVPIFWVAGEDHDYLEINHMYVPKDGKMEKKVYPERVQEKKMASDIIVDKAVYTQWVEEIIKEYGETDYSRELLDILKKTMEQSSTMVDLFSHFIMRIFHKYGLLLVDSGDKEFRKLEKEIFLKQIDSFQEIAEAVNRQQEEVKKKGYSLVIEMTESPVNLFYYDEDKEERILLQYDTELKLFIGKDRSVFFTKEELKEIASEFPARLSNNVVTRPITQDLLFPTIAFIGGPGEIAYWAELKQAFEALELKMPPIVPRLNITFMERCVESDMKELGLSVEDVLIHGTKASREAFLQSVSNERVSILLQELKRTVASQYSLLEKEIQEDYRGLLPLLSKNEGFLLKQLDFMETKLEEAVCLKHDTIVRKFNRLEQHLKPEGSPQERVWNITYFFNKFGLSYLDDVMKLPMICDGKHKLIRL